MMRWNVTVAAVPGREALADEVCERLSSAWRSGVATKFHVAGGSDSLEAEVIRTTDAVILIADSEGTQSVMLNLLHMLEEAGVPVLALLSDEPGPGNMFEFAGAVVDEIDAPDDRLCAVLTGLLHRQREVKRLRGEVALSQRFHGGLKNQIARMHEELARRFIDQFLPATCLTVGGQKQCDHIKRVVP